MYSNNYVLAVLAVISISAYCIKAWNNTTLPIIFSKILAKCNLVKPQNRIVLDSTYTREDWQLWSSVILPDWAVSWLNCSICQTPYVSAFFSWVIMYKLGGFSFSYTALGWCLSLIAIIKLQDNSPATTLLETPNLKTSKVTKTTYKMPENLDNYSGPLKKVKEETVVEVAPKNIVKETIKKDLGSIKPALNNINNSVMSINQAKVYADSLLEQKLAEAQHKTEQQLTAASNQYNAWQQEMGIETKKGPNGENIIVGFNPLLVETLKFFKEDEPCFFEGCEELRSEHSKELAAKGADCPACSKSELQRKYMVLVKRAIENQKRIRND